MTDTTNKAKDALFIYVPEGDYYLAANKMALAAGAILSKMRLTEADLRLLRLKGYTTRLQNGQEIGRMDIRA